MQYFRELIFHIYFKSIHLKVFWCRAPIISCSMDDDLRVCNVFETRRGKRCINVDNFKFREIRTLKSGDTRYRCTNKKCSASVLVNESNEILRKANAAHDRRCEYDHRTIVREVVRSSLKRSAENDLYAKPNKLISRELQNTENSDLNLLRRDDMKSLRRSVYGTRKKHLFPNTTPKSRKDAKKRFIVVNSHAVYKGNECVQTMNIILYY